jgi:hypothetical protein
VKEKGRSVVRHYLLDFGSTIGSARIAPRDPFDRGWRGDAARQEKNRAGFGPALPIAYA